MTSLAELLATDWPDLSDDVRHDLAVHVNATAGALSARYRHMVVVMDVLGGRVRAGNVVEIARKFGGAEKLMEAVGRMQELLYAA